MAKDINPKAGRTNDAGVKKGPEASASRGQRDLAGRDASERGRLNDRIVRTINAKMEEYRKGLKQEQEEKPFPQLANSTIAQFERQEDPSSALSSRSELAPEGFHTLTQIELRGRQIESIMAREYPTGDPVIVRQPILPDFMGDTVFLTRIQEGERWERLLAREVEALYRAGRDPSIWQYTADQPGGSREAMDRYVAEALREQREGTGHTFVVSDRKNREVVGIIRMYNVRIEPGLREAEVGYWLSPEAQGRGIYAEASYLYYSYIFELLDMGRIVFSINSKNERSIGASKKIGARFVKEEKNTPPFADAEPRDSVIYEITRDDWNQRVRALMESRLHRD